MPIGSEGQLPRINTALIPQSSDDPRDLYERLEDYADRGMASPESLSLSEIRQISIALGLYIRNTEH